MHSSHPITKRKPSGRVRFSVGFMGRAVAEIEYLVTTHPGNPFSKQTLSSWTEWRSAKKDDIDYLVRLGVLTVDSPQQDIPKSYDSQRDTKMRPVPPNPHKDSSDGM